MAAQVKGGRFPRAYVNDITEAGDPKLVYVGADGTSGFEKLDYGARKAGTLPKTVQGPKSIDHVGDTSGKK